MPCYTSIVAGHCRTSFKLPERKALFDMLHRFLFLLVITTLITGCAGISNRIGSRGFSDSPDIIGVRGTKLNIKHADDSYGGEVIMLAKDPRGYVLDIGYGACTMAFKGHDKISNGDARATVLNTTLRYYLSQGASKGFYVGAGFTQWKFSYKIDPETREQIEADNGLPAGTYRERIGDAYVPHYEIGLDMPIGDKMELGFGVREVDLSTDIKHIYNGTTDKVKASLDPTVWFFTLSILF